MASIEVKLIRDTPGKCPKCIEDGITPVGTVTEVYANWCKPCRGQAYLEFRAAMHWPLDAKEMKALGFIP